MYCTSVRVYLSDEIPRKECKRRVVVISPLRVRKHDAYEPSRVGYDYHSIIVGSVKDRSVVATSDEAVATYCERNPIERRLFDRSKDDGMSSGTDECKLKGGHPPAVKAGGMRITQHKTPKDERETKPSKDVEDSKPSSSPPKTIMISGAPAKGNADFPPEAVQHFHEKPTPTHDARPAHCSRPIIIQQPRK